MITGCLFYLWRSLPCNLRKSIATGLLLRAALCARARRYSRASPIPVACALLALVATSVPAAGRAIDGDYIIKIAIRCPLIKDVLLRSEEKFSIKNGQIIGSDRTEFTLPSQKTTITVREHADRQKPGWSYSIEISSNQNFPENNVLESKINILAKGKKSQCDAELIHTPNASVGQSTQEPSQRVSDGPTSSSSPAIVSGGGAVGQVPGAQGSQAQAQAQAQTPVQNQAQTQTQTEGAGSVVPKGIGAGGDARTQDEGFRFFGGRILYIFFGVILFIAFSSLACLAIAWGWRKIQDEFFELRDMVDEKIDTKEFNRHISELHQAIDKAMGRIAVLEGGMRELAQGKDQSTGEREVLAPEPHLVAAVHLPEIVAKASAALSSEKNTVILRGSLMEPIMTCGITGKISRSLPSWATRRRRFFGRLTVLLI